MHFKTDYTALYTKIFDIIGDNTPIVSDCGRLCEARCCTGEKNDGMFLFPHEEEVLDLSSYDVVSADSGKLLVCNGRCNRQNRPLACRIFPLIPLLCPDGIIKTAIDPGAFRLCPLAARSENVRFCKSFIRAVRKAGRLLTADSECLEYLKQISAENSRLLSLLPIPDGGIVSGRRK